jgi:hypothetical protein
MYSINSSVVQSYPRDPSVDRQFVLCESCFWSATIFKSKVEENVSRNLGMCPVCFNKDIAIIPIGRDI